MDLLIKRTYYPTGTNGEFLVNGKLHSKCIELPWKDNQSRISCIPEGKYKVVKRTSDHFGAHMLITNVPKRDLILIHPANNALKELKGCIAPVTELSGHGTGNSSRAVFEPLRDIIYHAIDHGEEVWLTITRK